MYEWEVITKIVLQEHLFLVCELLRANLYEFQKYNREQGEEPYFTLPRVQSIARQVCICSYILKLMSRLVEDLIKEGSHLLIRFAMHVYYNVNE